MIEESLWQETPGAIWYSSEKQVCAVCNKKKTSTVELKTNDESMQICNSCLQGTLKLIFRQNKYIEFLWARKIEYKSSDIRPKKEESKKREPVGLSKRYSVMKRDGFQCVLCGVSGKESQLEIDHIIPVIIGGNGSPSNLQTLCFKCNRGKRDKQ